MVAKTPKAIVRRPAIERVTRTLRVAGTVAAFGMLTLIQAAQPIPEKSVSLEAITLIPSRPQATGGQGATQMPDGRWLLSGGSSDPGALAIFDPIGRDTEALPTKLLQGRSGHTATFMPDGTVLLFGGVDEDGNVLGSAEEYDPSTGAQRSIAESRLIPRVFHTATVLTDGRVLIAGGKGADGGLITAVEIYDPMTGSTDVMDGGTLTARVEGSAELLPSGSVLLFGGKDAAGNATSSAAIVDPVAKTVTLSDTASAASMLISMKSGSCPAEWCTSRSSDLVGLVAQLTTAGSRAV